MMSCAASAGVRVGSLPLPLDAQPPMRPGWKGVALELSPREFHLMLALAREPGVVVPKGVLAQRLEPLGDALDFGAVEVHMSNLRRKIGAGRIRTVRGIGYLFNA